MATLLLDPWLRTISLLAREYAGPTTPECVAANSVNRRTSKGRARPSAGASARLIERPTLTTVTVAWSDSTLGCFGNQTWRLGVARHAGVCAISGRIIGRGDEVFKPFSRPTPANARAMILAVMICGNVDN
ncbi:DUF3331 domain-containing protein [Paraburkholderia sp. EG287B]|uniref:DUF3331 domain-containing protein n=1 Tax=Paraburkholderia sp. EG287B TaxID=3237010 RepID=UPI0034D2DD4A